MHRTKALLLSLGVCLAVGSLPNAALAAPTAAEVEKARATFRAGTALEAANDWGNALAKFREVAAVKSSAQVLFHIGRCLEHLGKWTEAVGQYRLAEDSVEKGKNEVQKEIEAARKALEARMPKLTIRRGIGADSVSIAIDGTPLGAPMIGAEMPVDPGPHTILAMEDGQERFSQKIAVHENESKSLTIDIQTERTAVPPTSGPAVAPVVPPSSDDKPTNKGGWKTFGYVAGGLGVASLVASGVFLYMRQKTISDLDKVCIDGHCPPDSKSTEDSGKLYQTVSLVTLGVGVVGLAVGSVLVFTSKSESPAKVSVTTAAPGALGGLSVQGSF
jgi:hypothetical protein